jgi:sortase A
MKGILHWIETGLWIVAVVCLGTCGYAYSQAAWHQASEKELFSRLRARDAREASYFGSAAIVGEPDPGKLVGILSIPEIGLSAVVDQGDDSRTLRSSVGHVPGTALPGGPGNAVLAAHRDTYFRKLYKLRPGDAITFRSLSGTLHYTVKSIRVVAPTDIGVMNPSPQPVLTLITCFPFYYIGNAPKRFVLVAAQDSQTSDLSEPPKPDVKGLARPENP